MSIKDFWTRTGSWLRNHGLSKMPENQPQVDDDGLITEDTHSTEPSPDEQPNGYATGKNDNVVVQAIAPVNKAGSLEKLQAGFDKLIDKLQGINGHLNRQVAQNEELMSRIEQLPQLLEGFPALLENQKQITQRLLEQLNLSAVKNQQFIDIVGKIPNETAKQTDALVNVNHQLAAAADIDVQMAEGFNKFNETLDKLNQSTLAQTDSMTQMSKTYATSDRYLKYIITRQNKRFVWVFIAAVSVCLAVILILTLIIIYLKQ
jgi:hypothetical protein